MRFGGLALFALVACSPRAVEGPVTASEGLSVAVYTSLAKKGRGYAVVDDRRTIDVTGDSILIERVAPGAELSSLIVEPLGKSSLRIGACSRESLGRPPVEEPGEPEGISGAVGSAGPIPEPSENEVTAEGLPPRENPAEKPSEPRFPMIDSPVVRCAVLAGRGRHRVRILYVTPDVTFAAHHDIEMTAPTSATVTTRFALPTPDLDTRGEVALYAGLPGSDETPTLVGRSEVVFDGSISLFGAPRRDVRARLRRIWRSVDPSEAREDVYLAQQGRPVRVWLELEGPLEPGEATVRVELPHEPASPISVPAESVERGSKVTRMPVREDLDLISLHESRPLRARDAAARERFSISISNAGPVAREVYVVFALTKGKGHEIESSWPSPPTIERDTARSKVQVEANSVGRLRYTIATSN